MTFKIRTFVKTTTGRYIIIGLSVYVLELAAIIISQRLGASTIVAVAISFWIGLLVSFFLQKIVTFNDKRMHHKVLLPQLIAVVCLVFFNFGFTILVTRLLRGHLPAVIIRTFVLGITTLWNFYIYRTRIFKNEDFHPID